MSQFKKVNISESEKKRQKTRTYNERKSSGEDDVFVNVSMADLRKIINESVGSTIRIALNEHKIEVLESVTSKLSSLEAQLDIIGGENDLLRRENSVLKERVVKNEAKLTTITTTNNDNQTSWQEAMKWCNENEQYGRRWCLRIHGHPMKANENCKREVVGIVSHKLQIKTLTENDIDAAHRIGRPRDGKPPAIIVRFFRRDWKEKVISSRRQLKGTGYVITEDLTSLNQKLLNRARFHEGVNAAWSWNGHIWCETKDGLKVKLHVYEDINAVIAQSHQHRGRDHQRPPPGRNQSRQQSDGKAAPHQDTPSVLSQSE